MIYYLKILLRLSFKRRGILLVAAYFLMLMVSSTLIRLVEPGPGGLSEFDQALWWSIVTTTTVGYGDLYPSTNAGKVIAVILPMFMGIGLGAAFITHIASSLIERRDKKMHGEKPYTGSGHIVIAGLTAETGQLINEILNDDAGDERDIVLIADANRHPFSEFETVFFIKGRPDGLDALKKAGISNASRVAIHTGSDEETLFALVNALKLKNETCEVTVRCISSQSLDTFSSVPGDFQIIMQMTAEMMVQAMQDKVHLPLQILLKNNEAEEIYYLPVPDRADHSPWWHLHEYFKSTYDYLTFALHTSKGEVRVNPSKDRMVSPKDAVWLLANRRPVHVKWP